MKPRELVATARVPGHSGELRCYHHDGDYEVWIDRTELMSSRVHGSEERLAELVFERLGHRRAPNILVGGLGMGFTLARTLALVSAKAKVDVAEIVPEMIAWNRDVFGHCAGHPLRDERVQLVENDVRRVVATAANTYDAILLDVDNGPEGLCRPDNDSLYNKIGLRDLHQSLRASGVLGIWSSADDRSFDARVRRVRWRVEKHSVKARLTKGPRRTIWTAARG